jgi:hypothetical protein
MMVKNMSPFRRTLSANFQRVFVTVTVVFVQTQFAFPVVAQSPGASQANCSLASGTSVLTCRASGTPSGSITPPAVGTLTLGSLSPGSGACPAGSSNPRVTVGFTQAAQNFILQRIEGSAFGTYATGAGTHVTRINVGPTSTDTTLNHQYKATWGIVQDDTTTFSSRTVSLSQICGDFSADKIVFTNTLGGSFSLITSDDAARANATTKVVTEGVWYINVRNDDCPTGTNCSITGIYTNRNR